MGIDNIPVRVGRKNSRPCGIRQESHGADGEDWEKVVKRERQRTCANVWNFPRGEVGDENL